MAAVLALISAVLFALSATLQQLGQFVLARKGKAVTGLAHCSGSSSCRRGCWAR